MSTINETIKIIIRTTNNKYTDFTIEITSSLTVYELKQIITLNHPTKPIPKTQRLIYSGKLLEDKNILHQIFIKSNSGSSFMVHLVLDSDRNESSSTTSQPTTIKSSNDIEESPSISLHSISYEQYTNELNKYQQQLQQFMLNPYGNFPTSSVETQSYLQYCYTHHQMYQNYLIHQRPSSLSPPPTTTPSTSIPTVTSQSTNVPPPPRPAANNNEFDQENDLLGTLHIIIEVFLLCSIIYFYSTFNRFLFVLVIFALLYLHCRGYLSIQRRQRVQMPPVVEQPVGNDVEQGIDEEIHAEHIQNNEQNTNDIQLQESPSAPLNPIVDNQITPTRLLFTAVSTFFSSLIPERPQRI